MDIEYTPEQCRMLANAYERLMKHAMATGNEDGARICKELYNTYKDNIDTMDLHANADTVKDAVDA